MTSTYVLRGGAEGAKRLKVVAEASWPQTRRLLKRAGLRRGWSCLDVGCGNGHAAIEISRIAGREGSVVGVDVDAGVLDVARDEGKRRRSTAEFRQADAGHLNVTAAYDMVCARFLLTHLPSPEQGLAGMVAAARPGGVVVAEDIDFSSTLSYPQCDAYDRYCVLYRQASERPAVRNP